MADKLFYTYLLLTKNNTYYCGYTDDIRRRYSKHLNGLGAKYTRANKPVKIAYLKTFDSKSEAMKEENRIKKLSRCSKEELVNNFSKIFPDLFKLAQEISFCPV